MFKTGAKLILVKLPSNKSKKSNTEQHMSGFIYIIIQVKSGK